jgi:hypothetical protein
MSRILVVGFVLLFCNQHSVCVGASAGQSDEEITRLLLGKWLQEYPAQKGLSQTVTVVYQSDGTFSGEAKFFLKGDFLKLAKFAGAWQVRNGEMTETVKTSDSIFYSVGMTMKYSILSITDQKITISSEGKQTNVKTRVRE